MIKDLIKAKGEEIAVLEGTDRLQYLIDLAKEAKDLDNQHKVDQNKIFGCASNLWVVGKKSNGKMEYQFDADAFITKGTTKFVIDILNHQPVDEIAKLTKDDFKPLGIMELLTAQRQSGLSNLLDFVIRLAK